MAKKSVVTAKKKKRMSAHARNGARCATVTRETTETKISVDLIVDGKGKSSITTGIPFLDHMLTLFSRHGLFDVTLSAKGDLEVDNHHTNEDVGICLGMALMQSLGDKTGIRRYGSFVVPMDEALVRVVLDISNRPSLYLEGIPKRAKGQKEYSFFDCEHFLQSFVLNAGINMHVTVLAGKDRHHIIEAIFKALARALDVATSFDSRSSSVPSTKGVL